jgi:aryl-alcohol dehydrogenase-like predicted oxidoreductase
LLDRRIERELLPATQSYGIGVIPWSPLAGGFLTGKYQRQGQQPDGRFSDRSNPRANGLLDSPRAFDVVQKLQGLATERSVTLSQLALAWVVQQPGITSAIIGPRTGEQLEDNLKALELKLTAADLSRIDAVVPPREAVVPFYEAEFGPTQHHW